MSSRSLLVALIVLATIGFVVGISIEKGNDNHEPAAVSVTQSGEAAGHTESGDETGHSEAGGSAEAAGEHSEFKPLGINLESTPLIVLAAVASLALALLAWLRPRWRWGLWAIFIAMGVFAALDIAEVVHQSDIDETGLAVLAAIVAVLHGAAAFVAGRMATAATV